MKKSLSLQNIKVIDKANVLGLLLDFPLQCRAAQALAKNTKLLFKKKDFRNIIFSGVGGSAIGADLVKAYLYSESEIPINVYRDYELPKYVDEATLVFILSYSGNAQEAISAYMEAKKKNAFIVVISSGGKLRELAKSQGVSFIEIPGGLIPRFALGYLSIMPLCILASLGLIKDVELFINEMVRELEGLKNKAILPLVGQKDNIAKYIASRLYNKFAVIYSSSAHFDVCSRRLRNQLNENSKTLAFNNFFPEINHNEIEGWHNPAKLLKNFLVLMLRDKDTHPSVRRSIDLTKEMLKKEGIEVLEVWSRGESLLARIFSLIYIGDFISYYLAILYGIDPAVIERIDYLKKELARQ